MACDISSRTSYQSAGEIRRPENSCIQDSLCPVLEVAFDGTVSVQRGTTDSRMIEPSILLTAYQRE
ncbi:MAG: hypothetical protein HXS42_15480 [Theionarchaea archaeon]|nr:hypothetical protein [Theionarchaea archaeon]